MILESQGYFFLWGLTRTLETTKKRSICSKSREILKIEKSEQFIHQKRLLKLQSKKIKQFKTVKKDSDNREYLRSRPSLRVFWALRVSFLLFKAWIHLIRVLNERASDFVGWINSDELKKVEWRDLFNLILKWEIRKKVFWCKNFDGITNCQLP